MSISIFLLLELCSLVAALPAGGSGGTRGGSSGGTRGSGGSSGSSSGGSSSSSGGSSSTGGGKKGSGWTSSRNNGSRSSSGPLSKTAKIILAVIGGIILLVILFVLFKIFRDRYRKRKETKYSPPPEKATSSSPSVSSARSSIEHPATLSHNPGHTQAAVHPTPHPTTNAELTSAVMTGEGSRAGHGESGAGSGSRGGVGPVQWELRALAAISKGMSTNNINPPPHGAPPSGTTEAIKVRPSPHALLGRQY
ncbi:hypothetical protein RHS03_03027, partial [Rhizoctonia solani]